METCIFHIIWLLLYWYYTEQAGEQEKGAGKRVLGFLITAVLLVLCLWLPCALVWVLVSAVLLLYDLFFDREPFQRQWPGILLPGLVIAGASVFPKSSVFVLHGLVVLVFLLLLAKKRGSLRPGGGILTALIYLLTSVFLWILGDGSLTEMEERLRTALLWGGSLLEILLFFVVEGTLLSYKRGFEFRTEQFRKELMEYQYEEIKSVYMDMRGWRHDYHNHMQVMKAQLTLGNLKEIREYLDKLERELDRVDTFVRSGNLMVDAILNSKLTLAGRQEISVNCKARAPKKLSVEDVDLCVILGNLLDNALEACAMVEKENRFLRVYMTVNKSQMYLSVQNSASREPDFEARNYITRKRGNHGLGMKRVKAAVDKYGGFLNLANEAGIFAAEVTLPLDL